MTGTGSTHLDPRGRVRMVDVAAKPASTRVARAEAVIRLGKAARKAVLAGKVGKGDTLAVARIAGIMAAKETPRLIPLCHPLSLSSVGIEISAEGSESLRVQSEVSCVGPTGVEMEAMTAASVAALTIYDMCKSIERGITIERIALLHKSGGKSGTWDRPARRRS